VCDPAGRAAHVLQTGAILSGNSRNKKYQPERQKLKMSLSIRPLLKKVVAECALCNTQRELASWDANLGDRICEECEPFLEAAEIALVVAKCSHPGDPLIFRNP
jgi:hypothetical protein